MKAVIALRKALSEAIEAKVGALDAIPKPLIKAAAGRAGLITFPFAQHHYQTGATASKPAANDSPSTSAVPRFSAFQNFSVPKPPLSL